MGNSSYGIGLSNKWSEEERRLSAVEEPFDPGTFRHLDTIGIAWHVLPRDRWRWRIGGAMDGRVRRAVGFGARH